MKYEAEVKDLLIDNAIHVIAETGFEFATTYKLSHRGGDLPGLKMNDAYIYRLFGSKEGLYEAAFISLDQELYQDFMQYVAAVKSVDESLEKHLYRFFGLAWDDVLSNEAKFRYYIKYYYSAYYKGRAQEVHNQFFREIASTISYIFKPEADIVSIIHSAFTSLLSSCNSIYNGFAENNEEHRTRVFHMMYHTVVSYLDPELAGTANHFTVVNRANILGKNK